MQMHNDAIHNSVRVQKCTVLRTLSDLGGGVNGHDVNLRDKCGVCDDVTG